MSALDQILRLHRWSLDEKRRQAADLDRLRDKLGQDLARIDADLASEAKQSGASLELQRALPAYSKVMRTRRERLALSIADIEREAAKVQSEIGEAYQELKKYEQALSNRAAREKLTQRRREQIADDETAINIFRRKG